MYAFKIDEAKANEKTESERSTKTYIEKKYDI